MVKIAKTEPQWSRLPRPNLNGQDCQDRASTAELRLAAVGELEQAEEDDCTGFSLTLAAYAAASYRWD
jgi:hypothetical protein